MKGFFKKRLLFRAVVGSQQSRENDTKISHISPDPLHTCSLSIISISHQTGTPVTTDESAVTYTSH